MNSLDQKKMNVKIADPWETMLDLIMRQVSEKDEDVRREYAWIMLDALKELTVKED